MMTKHFLKHLIHFLEKLLTEHWQKVLLRFFLSRFCPVIVFLRYLSENMNLKMVDLSTKI